MKNAITFRQFLFKNVYLLLIAAWLVTLSFIVDNYWASNSSIQTVQKKVSTYIHQQEKDLGNLVKDSVSIQKLASGRYTEHFLKKLLEKKYFLFIYNPAKGSHEQLQFWSTNQVVPATSLLYERNGSGTVKLENGFYTWYRYRSGNFWIIGLVPVKWDYDISNGYLANGFVKNLSISYKYDITTEPGAGVSVNSINGNALFNIIEVPGKTNNKDNFISVILRLIATLFVFLFIHFCANYISSRKLWQGIFFFLVMVIGLRVLSYYYPIPMNFRQFELFDPAVYGSDNILRSLGDLLINALIFVWFILFIRNSFHEEIFDKEIHAPVKKWFVLGLVSTLLLFISFQGSNVIRSMISDSQISFDVINFFSLNIYSIIGFIILCCISIGYFFLCQFLLYFTKPYFSGKFLPVFLFIAIEGLVLLTINLVKLSGEFEIAVLAWLLVFLFFLNSASLNMLATRIVSSKLVFWLFFFSVSITSIIISENKEKELRNRKHYAEILSTKADPSNETLINTMLTDFRADYLSANYNRLLEKSSNHFFKDSLINGNFSGYTNKYDTRIFTFTHDEKDLFNTEPYDYNGLNTILNTQSKPTGIPGLYYFDEAYDRFSYISKKTLTDTAGNLLGYVFILANPKKFKTDAFYPELFSRGKYNSIENSSLYAFATYINWKLITSHNDYPFATTINKKDFPREQFFSVQKENYHELWYYSGANKMIVIAKKNSLSIESITLFSYLFCGFLLLTALFWLIGILVLSRFNMSKLKSYWQLSIRNQVHGTIIFVSIVSFLVIGGATILFFISRYESTNREKLSRTIHIMENEVKGSISKGWKLDDSNNDIYMNDEGNLEQSIKKISEIHGVDVNLYDLRGNLKVSSLPLPYVKGILSTKMEPMAFFHINNLKEVQYFQKEHIGELNFVSNYVPVIDASGDYYAYLNIPYFTSESNLKNEISNFLITIINLNAFIFLIAGIVALFITNRITNSFSLISDKMRKINLEKRNEYIEWNRKDELGALVAEYNKMVSKLDESAMALAKTEREGAWREMARQVAHEIKNPLTPMKLSMQFLQKSIDNNTPNVKALTESVAKTLIEQIDHLNQIAGEFSQFANIGNMKPELIDINDAIATVIHLYASNDRLDLQLQLLPEKIIVEADKTHMNRLFTNLILNALQAVPENTRARISINEHIDNGFVIISIADNGAGIAEEVRSKIFTPNFTTKTSGTGLGLAMCKRIVEQAKGEIWFETSPGTGSVFFVKLPVVG